MKLWKKYGLCVIGALLLVIAAGCQTEQVEQYSCLVRPIVHDAYTDEPIAEAEVIIAELEKSFITDETGSIAWMEVGHSSELPKLYTIVTIAEGYLPSLLYFICPFDAEPLNGPVIYLFPEGKESLPNTAMINAPEEEYTRNLIDTIRKKAHQVD